MRFEKEVYVKDDHGRLVQNHHELPLVFYKKKEKKMM